MKRKFTVVYKQLFRAIQHIEADGFKEVGMFIEFWEYPRDKDGKVTTEKRTNPVIFINVDEIFAIEPQ